MSFLWKGETWNAIKLLQVNFIFRIITFLVNIAIARVAHPMAYGMANVSWLLLESSSLCFMKEGIRRVALRATEKGKKEHEELRDIRSRCDESDSLVQLGSWLSCAIIIILGFIWLHLKPVASFQPKEKDSFISPYLIDRITICLVCGGLLLQACAEVKVVRSLSSGSTTLKTQVEGVSLICKTLSIPLWTFILGFFKFQLDTFNCSLLSFALGHFTYGAIFFLGFSFHLNHREKQPKNLSISNHNSCSGVNRDASSKERKNLVLNFTFLAFEKLILNEVERGLLLFLYPSQLWAVYSLATNLGSLVCRLVFAPLEELAAVQFSAKNEAQIETLLESFQTFLIIHLSVAFSGLCIGIPLAKPFIQILYGAKWISLNAHVVLQKYLVLLAIMALNGPCEAFMYSIASNDWLKKLHYVNVINCGLGVGVSAFSQAAIRQFIKNNGAALDQALISSLLLGSIVAHILRISVVCLFLSREFRRRDISSKRAMRILLPSWLCKAIFKIGVLGLTIHLILWSDRIQALIFKVISFGK